MRQLEEKSVSSEPLTNIKGRVKFLLCVLLFYKKKVYTNANVLENIISYHIYVTTLAMNCIQSIITLDMFDS